MVDEMVLKAQKWVNTTYGAVAGYNRCAEDGSTGWSTIYSLTRALQHELGITSLVDNFGATTLSKLTAHGNVSEFSSNRNIRTIAEAALYCKGYSGGGVDGDFGMSTQVGLSALVEDMGLYGTVPVGVITPKIFKALLTMDAYVLISGGSGSIRTCQQWLNKTYTGRGQYFIGPCDGKFSRNVQVALVLAIQYELGMTDSQVTGYIGPGTKTGLQTAGRVSTSTGTANWIRLFQTAMACNDYYNEWGDAGGSFPSKLASTVRAFQEFCKLPQSGEGDFATWMSLLVSTGDPDRPGEAIDVMYPLNRTTIATVKSLGYKYAGRYLTGGTNKVLTHSEIALILDNGMSIFPLYQEWGDKVQYFSYDQGFEAGRAAYQAAVKFGFPAGTVIYFSVDFDALDTEISSYVIPHFRGVVDGVRQSPTDYAVGVYGCRNVCIQLAAAGLTSRSFVSGMSTGYSGNLGYPLPNNWAFDQIRNYTVTSGSSPLELDHDVVSGRDLGVNSVTRPRDPNDAFYTYLIWLEARAWQWREEKGHTTYSQAELVGQWLRMLDGVTNNKVYGWWKAQLHVSDEVFGEFDQDFIDYVKSTPGRPDLMPLRDPVHLWDNDITHFGASFGAVVSQGIAPDRSMSSMSDFGSWGGDLLSILGQINKEGVGEAAAYAYAKDLIAARADNTYFDLMDYMADVDALVMGVQCRADRTLLLSDLFKHYYGSTGAANGRFVTFIGNRFGTRATMQAAAESMFDTMVGGRATVIRDLFWHEQDFGFATPALVSSKVRTAVAEAFADVATRFAS
ncbi:glycoside hydrolase domain-containing protein [Actinoplanes sp. NBRC 101535]|uniref:glycoside hydrolase domain-containing protein n=1 Tax=Actinoplanes sp. NBRC 101535 TaxID=3032196 RepID=UPI002556B540|nr:glycoside hydrolase domain-containing protein [Actinoplanes sp. NBRC 101535]